MKVLNNPYLVALGIPLILIFSGALAKKLVRGSEWQRTDFFLGVELSLAAMASSLVYLFDLAKVMVDGKSPVAMVSERMVASASFLALCFFILLWVLSVHQDWERRVQNQTGQLMWLTLIANFVAAGLLAAFVLLVKGV